MQEKKREPTPITKALKSHPTNPISPTLYARKHGFNENTFRAVRVGEKFNKEIIIQLLVDGYTNEVIETFKDDGGKNVQ